MRGRGLGISVGLLTSAKGRRGQPPAADGLGRLQSKKKTLRTSAWQSMMRTRIALAACSTRAGMKGADIPSMLYQLNDVTSAPRELAPSAALVRRRCCPWTPPRRRAIGRDGWRLRRRGLRTTARGM